jgi:hypothetical protein
MRRLSGAVIALTLLSAEGARAEPPPETPARDQGEAPRARDPEVAREPHQPKPALPPVAFLPAVVAEDGERRAPAQGEPEVVMMATGLDALLSDTAQDLGLNVDLTYRSPTSSARLLEADLVAQARAMGGILVAPSLELLAGGDVEIRLLLADARSRALKLRVERVARDDLAVRAVVMLRDLVLEARASGSGPPASSGLGAEAPRGVLATPALSAGRATLAINATLWGGLVGFSIQRASGSNDPRLLYPLLAVGAGIGLGGAIIVAEEWDVGVGDAWYLVSGAWWPTISAHLVYEGRFTDLPGGTDLGDERWTFGLIGSTAGITLATLGLTLRGMSEGGALLAHSGGGLGLVLGGLAELAAEGDIYRVPFAGMGYGAGLGWLAAAAAATVVDVSPPRVLAIDLGGIVGGLGGAALGSPLLFGEPTAGQQRAWLGITAGGSLLGAGFAWYMTRGAPKKAEPRAKARSGATLGVPLPGILGESVMGERRAPVLGLQWRGTL